MNTFLEWLEMLYLFILTFFQELSGYFITAPRSVMALLGNLL